jgi:hypothetical protein
MRKILVSMLFGALTLAGCGGGDADTFRDPGDLPGGGGGGGTASALTVVSSVTSIPTDGSANATITAFARDASNNLIRNVPVTFTATSGGLAGAQTATDENGAATVTLSTAGDPVARTIIVTAASGSLTANVSVQVAAAGGPSATVSMGSPAGAGFTAGVLAISNPALSAGGSTSLQAVLQQSDGTLYTQQATVNFSSACAAQNLATITQSSVQTSSGIANATYAATGCSGPDVVTATATVGGTPVSATGTVTVAAGAIGSIVFVSATPTNVALRGTGSSNNPETSTVVFRVLDQAGGPRVGVPVTFSLNTSVGGISFAPASATSDASGNVQTVVQGGTVATTVRVTASVATPALSTQSSQLTVTTGIPDQDSFSLAVECPNVEAWNRDGVVVAVTTRLSDRFNNPVPNGTAVTLQTEGGSIVPQCQTSGGNGACVVNWTSSNPRPPVAPDAAGDIRAGRSTVYATAIGEESFTDTNGNGSFDNGEVFADLPERFLDINENNVRDSYEPIYDFNNNSAYDPLDGIFNGVLCLDTSGRCNTNSVTTGISAESLIIMSASTPSPIETFPNPGTVLAGGDQDIEFADLNYNPLPAETTIVFTASTGVTLAQPTSFTVPCTTEPVTYGFSATSDTVTAGTVRATITSPSGVTTLFSWGVTGL